MSCFVSPFYHCFNVQSSTNILQLGCKAKFLLALQTKVVYSSLQITERMDKIYTYRRGPWILLGRLCGIFLRLWFDIFIRSFLIWVWVVLFLRSLRFPWRGPGYFPRLRNRAYIFRLRNFFRHRTFSRMRGAFCLRSFSRGGGGALFRRRKGKAAIATCTLRFGSIDGWTSFLPFVNFHGFLTTSGPLFGTFLSFYVGDDIRFVRPQRSRCISIALLQYQDFTASLKNK